MSRRRRGKRLSPHDDRVRKLVEYLRTEAVSTSERFIEDWCDGDRSRFQPGTDHVTALKAAMSRAGHLDSSVNPKEWRRWCESKGIPHEILHGPNSYRLNWLRQAGIFQSAGYNEVDFRIWCQFALFSVLWANCGMPQYRVGCETATMLALTDPGNLKQGDVLFPYPAFAVSLGDGAPLWIEHKGAMIRVAVIKVQINDMVPAWRMRELANRSPSDWFTKDDPADWPAPGPQPQTVTLTLLGDGKGTPTIEHTVALDPDADVREWYASSSTPTTAPGVTGTFGEVDEADRPAMRGATRLVVSLCLHLTAHRPAPLRQRPSRVFAERVRAVGLPEPQDWLPTEIPAPKEVMAELSSSGATTSPSGELTIRHVVRGHWKMQPYGPGRSDRKLIRIEPYWRGAGDVALSKTIEVGPVEGGQ